MNLSRYDRQMLFPPLGEEGQRRRLASRALVCGCGALGSVIASTLARAGVGHLRIVDRDFLELNNLQRQVLYDERDVAERLPKSIAAAAKLRLVNSEIEIEPVVADLDAASVLQLVADVDMIVDGTDNFETRYLLNDVALQEGIPWVYGGCIGAEGQTMTILPGETPCFRCLMPEPPPPGATATCDTAGILGPVVNVVASIEAAEVIKVLSGNRDAVSRTLTVIEIWDNRVRQIQLDSLQDNRDCPACTGREFPWLDGQRGSRSAVLCGRNAVQLSFPGRPPVSLEALAAKLEGVGDVQRNRFLVRAAIGDHELTVFPDGRAIIGGTDDEVEARSLYAKYVGN